MKTLKGRTTFATVIVSSALLSLPAVSQELALGEGYSKGKALSVAVMRAKYSCQYNKKKPRHLGEAEFELISDNGKTKRWEARLVYECINK